MTYAVKQDFIDRFSLEELVQLTDRTNIPQTTVDDNVVNQALADTDAMVNSYLSVKLTLPLVSVPTMLKSVACDIARYRLYDDRATDQVSKRYDDAIKFLKAVASGAASLGVDAANQPAPVSGGVQFFAADRVFTPGSLSDYAQ
ncbi:MAG TPA: DUF1320 domain-containing protein [Usitatibacteraceae bacterium]